MIVWRPPISGGVAPPSTVRGLLERAIAADPAKAQLHMKLGNLALDCFDFVEAGRAFEAALRLDPDLPGVRPRLARCWNTQGLHEQALDILSPVEGPHHERAVAFEGTARLAEADSEYRAVLSADPHHRYACRMLGKILRRSGRTAELLRMCEYLAARGARHAQLLYSWGVALALNGEEAKARSILFDPARVAELSLPVPEGFEDIAAFNDALAEELLENPNPVSDFLPEEEANRGSSRVHSLFAGRRPELIRQLLVLLQEFAGSYLPPRYGTFDPWIDARPEAAHLNAWGLFQRGGEHEDWHLHRGGWLSGVYYVRVPRAVSTGSEGKGCIEFGAPRALERARPGFVSPWRHRPHEGGLLLAPSHYPHRTIPSGVNEYRISFAFDIVPEPLGG